VTRPVWSQTFSPSFDAVASLSSGTTASSGMVATSWKSRMPNAARPWGRVSSFFSARVCIANAVEESASAAPTMPASAGVAPKANASPPTIAPVAATWTVPTPKTAPRIFQRRLGWSSSPMRKSRSTTPSSAKCSVASTSFAKPRTDGPTSTPAAR
jgi:hypothetical protein